MPTIACPGCGKKYNVPATAAGQVAKCACGKKFRLGASKAPAAAAPAAARSTVSAAAKTKPNSTSAGPATKSRPTAPLAKKATDDFWDDALREEQTAKVVPTAPRPAPSAANSTPTKPSDAPKKKKKKQSSGVRWGADWGKVGGGLLTFLIAGGITLGLVVSTGRLFFWPAGIAIVGLFTALSGLMGEEGIW
jgi:hypothetical protein